MALRELEDVRLLADGLAFPEGPVILADGSLLVVEIRVGTLTRIWPDGTKSVVANVGGGPNGAARGPDGAIYLCNNGGSVGFTLDRPRIQRVDRDTGAVETLYTSGEELAFVGPNDLVFDEVGNFWFTDFGAGIVYYASPDGRSIRSVWSGLTTPNGIGLSPDGQTLYSAQTRTRQVLRRRVLSPGVLEPSPGYDARSLVRCGEANPDILLAGLPGAQELDSLAIDSRGAVCVGTLMESGITVISADGGSVDRLTLPENLYDPVVTNICFGGDDMQTAYITLSLTGRVVTCRWPVPGLCLNFQEL